MPDDNVDGAQNLLKRERDERTGEFSQSMLNENLGEASEALKQPNFDPSGGRAAPRGFFRTSAMDPIS